MAETNDTLSINLTFGSWKLPMRVRRADEAYYREAEKLIKDRYNFYTSNYPGQGTEMYLVMTVLDIAVRLKRTEQMSDPKPLTDRLQPLLDELESALSGHKQ